MIFLNPAALIKFYGIKVKILMRALLWRKGTRLFLASYGFLKWLKNLREWWRPSHHIMQCSYRETHWLIKTLAIQGSQIRIGHSDNEVVVHIHSGILLLPPSHFSHVQLFVTLWTITHQALMSIGFSRQEYWSGLPCLLQAMQYYSAIKREHIWVSSNDLQPIIQSEASRKEKDKCCILIHIYGI